MPCNLISSCFFPESPWFRDPADCGPGHQPGQPQHHDWQSNNHPGQQNMELSAPSSTFTIKNLLRHNTTRVFENGK